MITIKIPTAAASATNAAEVCKSGSKIRSLADLKGMIASHDLLEHDRRLLDRLASKRMQDLENESKARSFRQKWTQDLLQWKHNKQMHELLWHKEVMSKRKVESEINQETLVLENKVLHLKSIFIHLCTLSCN